MFAHFFCQLTHFRLKNSEANRRWSMALSSMGHSQTSAQSLQSIAGNDGGTYIFMLFLFFYR